MKKKISIPSRLKGWHSDYQTCLEVWQGLKDKALAHHFLSFIYQDNTFKLY